MSADLSLTQLVLDASLPVQLVMLILVIASVVSWGFIFTEWRGLGSAREEADQFEERFWSGGDLSMLYDSVRRHANTRGLEMIFASGFQEYARQRGKGAEAARVAEMAQRAMRVACARAAESFDRPLSFLATVGSTSPYIGLFGTVWGIMHAFIGLSGAQQATLAMVAPGIAEALIATAMGLFAAIPAVIAYNRFSADVEQLLVRYDNFTEEFTNLLSRQAASRGEDA